MKRSCIICGGRVRNLNPKCETCSPTCTAAKHAGRNLEEQIRFEVDNDIQHQGEAKYR